MNRKKQEKPEKQQKKWINRLKDLSLKNKRIQSMSKQMPVTVFFSYSHKDEDLRDKLAAHLKLMERTNTIDAWHDRAIPTGGEWDKAIKTELLKADIILLLISSDFLASDYIWDVEIKTAMQRHEAEDAVVVPVVLRDCDWFDAPFGKLQGLPKDAKPVVSYQNMDEAFTFIARKIKQTAKAIRSGKSIEKEAPSTLLEAPDAEDIPEVAISPLTTESNKQLELEGLKKIEKKLIKKLNFFRDQAITTADAEKQFSIANEIEEMEEQLTELRQKIQEMT